tara:strand:- start:3977 stop:4411 length:435 start_codon:yes stop_codon:yes gene_type:complete
MSINISYTKKTNNKASNNLILFTNSEFKLNHLNKFLSNSELSYIKNLLISSDTKKNIMVFDINSKKRIILISIKKDLKTSSVENLGAEFYSNLNHEKHKQYHLISDSIDTKINNFIGHFLHGLKLKSYEFKKYKTKKKNKSSFN